jgi:hypothetical protein
MTSYPIPSTCLSLSKEAFFFLLSLSLEGQFPPVCVSLSMTKVNISVSLVQDPILVIDECAHTIISGTLFEFPFASCWIFNSFSNLSCRHFNISSLMIFSLDRITDKKPFLHILNLINIHSFLVYSCRTQDSDVVQSETIHPFRSVVRGCKGIHHLPLGGSNSTHQVAESPFTKDGNSAIASETLSKKCLATQMVFFEISIMKMKKVIVVFRFLKLTECKNFLCEFFRLASL